MMTLCFTKANGKSKVVNIPGDSVTIKGQAIVDEEGHEVAKMSVSGRMFLTQDFGANRMPCYDTLEITQGEEG
jgi:hypothetical protein